MDKQTKIYHIDEVRKLEKWASVGTVASYGVWMASLIAEGGLYTIPPLLAYFLTLCSQDYLKTLVPKTEEWKRFKAAYQTILEEFSKTCKTFDAKEPLQVFGIFDIAYANNIFSIYGDNYFRLTRYDDKLMKELALNNHGVCRHVTMMLDDVYTRLGFQTQPIAVATSRYKEVAKEMEIPAEMQEAIKEMQKMFEIEINGEVIKPEDLHMGEAKMMSVTLEELKPTRKDIKRGNHAFNKVNYNGLSYYVDASKRALYVASPEPNALMDNSGRTVIYSPKGTKRFVESQGKEMIEDLPSLTLGDQIDIVNNAQDKVRNNQDVLKQLSKEIQEPLEEAEEMYKLILK